VRPPHLGGEMVLLQTVTQEYLKNISIHMIYPFKQIGEEYEIREVFDVWLQTYGITEFSGSFGIF
jgi:hypothetical protein